MAQAAAAVVAMAEGCWAAAALAAVREAAATAL